MVDSALLEKVLQLDAESRRELIRAVEGSLDYDDVSAEMLEIVDARLASKGPRPDADAISLDEFEARLRARRSA
ncbi:MAG: hypothetical protein QM622_02940 [Microbacterium sp.]